MPRPLQSSGRIFLVLEFCQGGDLSQFIRKNGRVNEPAAQHFMRQLGETSCVNDGSGWELLSALVPRRAAAVIVKAAIHLPSPCCLPSPPFPPLPLPLLSAAGLQVLRSHNVIHRDLKPQVLSSRCACGASCRATRAATLVELV